MKRTTLLIACLGFGLIGCKEDEVAAPTGTYEVLSHTRTEMTCDGDGADVMGETMFFSLELDDFLGATLLGWHDCSSADMCEEESSLLRSFIERGGEWVAESSSAGGFDECVVMATDGTVEETPDGVRIEFRTSSATFMLGDDEECSTRSR